MGKLTLSPQQEDIRRPIKPAVFFDLDGTIITTKDGKTFPKDKHDWKLISGVRALMLDLMNDDNTQIIIISNQGGIEQKYITKADFEEKMHNVIKALDLPNEIYCYYSTTVDPQDIYRKPQAGMFYIAALEHGIYLENSVFIGDASGTCEVPKDRILSDFVKDKQRFITTKARQEPQAVVNENVKTNTVVINCYSDSDLAASMNAGIANYRDIDQILYLFETKTKK